MGGPDAPAWFREHTDRTVAELGKWAAAKVEASAGIDEAVLLAADALAVLRAVQHIESPASADRIQTFGLPGQAPSALASYFSLSKGAPGWKRPASWPASHSTMTATPPGTGTLVQVPARGAEEARRCPPTSRS